MFLNDFQGMKNNLFGGYIEKLNMKNESHWLQSSPESKPHGSGDFSKTIESCLEQQGKRERVLVKSPDSCGLLLVEDCRARLGIVWKNEKDNSDSQFSKFQFRF